MVEHILGKNEVPSSSLGVGSTNAGAKTETDPLSPKTAYKTIFRPSDERVGKEENGEASL